MKYRRKFDILADVLRVAGSGARKTKIMYLANLSYVLLNKYLEGALRTGLVRFSGDEYMVTEKGATFLERYYEFSSQYSRVKADLDELKHNAELLDNMCSRRRVHSRKVRRNSFGTLG